MQDWDSINDAMCAEQKVVFKNVDDHVRKGGLKAMGESMDRYYQRALHGAKLRQWVLLTNLYLLSHQSKLIILSISSYFTGAMCWS